MAITRGIKHWYLSGYSNILPRIKFGVSGQESSPQSPTFHTANVGRQLGKNCRKQKIMIKKLLGGLFKKEKGEETNFIVATLNDKIMPIDRGEIYEDPLDDLLIAENIGEVSGGGTMQEKSGEINYCDIEIKLNGTEIDKSIIDKIIEKLENLGAPKGSVMNVEKTQEKINFGKLEGIGIYLDGTNLPKNVYEECDINFVITEIHRLTETEYIVNRNWENENGIALYFYGQSFEKMKTQIKDFVGNYPLCENCRMEKIA